MIPLASVVLTGIPQSTFLTVDTDVYDRLIVANRSFQTLDISSGLSAVRLQPNTIDLLPLESSTIVINPFEASILTAQDVLQLQAVRKDEQLTENYPVALQAPAPVAFATITVTGRSDFQAGLQAEGPVLFIGPDPWASASHPAFGATLPDGNTDNTQQVKNALAALVAATSSGGKGTLFLDPGVWSLNPLTVFGVVTRIKAAIGWPSNITIRGAGMGVTFARIITSGRLGTETLPLSMFVNSDPDNGNVSQEMYDLTLDGNRLNQGVYTYIISAAGGIQTWAPRLLHFQSVTDVIVDNVKVQNCAFIAVFTEGVRNCKIKTIIGENCTAVVGFDSGQQVSVAQGSSWNHDPVLAINTTATTVIAGGGAATIVPVSMAGIAVGNAITIDKGTPVFETILVTAITPGVNFTGYCMNAHGPGAYAVTSPMFASDAAFQAGPGVVGFTFGPLDVDYLSAQQIFGPALELFGCHDGTYSTVRAKGTWKGVWIHNWTITGVHLIAHDIAGGKTQCTNLQPSWSGLAPIGIHIDDQGYGSAEAIHAIDFGELQCRYGQGGAPVPAGALSFSDTPNSIWEGKIFDYGGSGIVLSTALGAKFELFSYASVGRGIYAPACHNTKGRIVIINPTIQGIAMDGNPGCQDNDWDMLVVGTPVPYPALTGQFGGNHTRNRFRGNVANNPGGTYIPPAVGVNVNDVHLTGYNPIGVVVVAVPATTVAVAAQPYDRTFYVTAAAGGPVTLTIAGGPAILIPANGLMAVHVPQNLTLTPVYGAGNAPTWVVEGE